LVGPILTVIRAPDFDQALRIANANSSASVGGLFSRSPAHVEQARRNFQVSNLFINRKTTDLRVDFHPLGGFKLSGTRLKNGCPDYLYDFLHARAVSESNVCSR